MNRNGHQVYPLLMGILAVGLFGQSLKAANADRITGAFQRKIFERCEITFHRFAEPQPFLKADFQDPSVRLTSVAVDNLAAELSFSEERKDLEFLRPQKREDNLVVEIPALVASFKTQLNNPYSLVLNIGSPGGGCPASATATLSKYGDVKAELELFRLGLPEPAHGRSRPADQLDQPTLSCLPTGITVAVNCPGLGKN